MAIRKTEVALFATGAGVALGAIYAANKAEEAGLHFIPQLLIRQVPLTVHRATRHELPSEETLHSLEVEPLQEVTIIQGGDSQGLPDDDTPTNPDRKDTMVAYAADILNKHYPWLRVKHKTHAEPGLMSTGLLKQLRERNSPLVQELLSADRAFFAFSVGLNDWQEVASNDLLDATLSMAGNTGERRGRIHEVVATAAKTLLSLAQGHGKVGNNLEGIIPEILAEVAKIDMERRETGKKGLSGVGVLCPANFGEAYAITVGQPGKKETRRIVLDHWLLKRMATMISAHASEKIEKGMSAASLEMPVLFVSSEGLEFARPEEEAAQVANPIRRKEPDQHAEQLPLGKNLAAALLAEYATVKEDVVVEEITEIAS